MDSSQQQQMDGQQMMGAGADQFSQQHQQQMDPALMAQFQMGMPGMMMGAGMGGMDPNMANMMQQQYAAAGYGQMPGYGMQNMYPGQMPQPGMFGMSGFGGQSYGGYGSGAGRGQGGFNKQQNNPQRFKTQLCRHFENSGQCTLGDKCGFAHGQHELRNFNDPLPAGASFPQTHSQGGQRNNYGGGQRSNQGSGNYKTAICKNFLNNSCKYGDKCSFAHGDHELKQVSFYQPKGGQNQGNPQMSGQFSGLGGQPDQKQ